MKYARPAEGKGKADREAFHEMDPFYREGFCPRNFRTAPVRDWTWSFS
jgi:hypothetical protein